MPLESFVFLTRIHYSATSDDEWGEHESETPPAHARAQIGTYLIAAGCLTLPLWYAVDYILVCQQDVDITPNPNEVNAVRWVKQSEIRDFCDEVEREGNGGLSPWFRLICDKLLVPKYWGNLAQIEAQTDGLIHRYGHAL